MSIFAHHPPLSAEDRVAKRRLIARDTGSLVLLFGIAVALGICTYFFFGSFARHRAVLAHRWQESGERYLKAGKPTEAIDALHSALEYSPGNRDIETELAMALAAAGRNREAAGYFRSLLVEQPGDGMIHLQLARLAAREGNADAAIEDYQRALDGTWHGNGYLERLSVRLELAGYLIYRKDYGRAQSELRTASGNAPANPAKQIQIAGMLEEAQDPADALVIYEQQMQGRDAPLAAFVGAGRTAYELGHMSTARDALARAVGQRSFAKQSKTEQAAVREMLENSERILALYPNPDLSVRERAERVQAAARIVQARLAACFAQTNANGELLSLTGQWSQLPRQLTVRRLERSPQLEQTTMSLVYSTEQQAARVCGPPSGDDALLLKMAQAPQVVLQ